MSIKGFLIDLNCDLGEGMENDALLMPYLGSCNIACGGHNGNEDSMEKALMLSKKNGVKAGAHPSYPDRGNFGRRWMDIDEKDLKESLVNQLQKFHKICQNVDIPMHHIKPHGALYNHAAKDANTAKIILEIIQFYFPYAILYCPPSSVIQKMAKEKEINHHLEVFADRAYQDDLSLLPRQHAGALLTEPLDVVSQVEDIIQHQKIKTVSGKSIAIKADTICLHGDNPNALNILKLLSAKMGNDN